MFCAGNDIGDFMTMAQGGALGEPIIRFLHALARNETPIVAAVNGNAVGVGTTMLLHCDYVVAGDTAKLSTPFVGSGLVPEAASSLIAPRLMGHARAFQPAGDGPAADRPTRRKTPASSTRLSTRPRPTRARWPPRKRSRRCRRKAC